MAAQPHVLTLCHLFGRHGRIEIEYAIGSRIRRDAVEIVLRHVQTQREDSYKPPRQREAFLPVRYTTSLEAGQVCRVLPHKLLPADVGLHLSRDRVWISTLWVVLRRVAPSERFAVVERL